MGKVYKTMQGKDVDMEKLMRQHELMPAIGNARVNARGDELGPGGKIIRKREAIIAEYYENNPKSKKEGPKIVETKPSTVQPNKKIKSNDVEDDNES
jgi:hypothetical protein